MHLIKNPKAQTLKKSNELSKSRQMYKILRKKLLFYLLFSNDFNAPTNQRRRFSGGDNQRRRFSGGDTIIGGNSLMQETVLSYY